MIGYASKTIGVQGTEQRTCTMKFATEENLLNIIEHNLNALEKAIDYNFQNNILLYRISSDIIPFGSSPINQLDWGNIFKSRFLEIGNKIKQYNMRVSMHPGQYTVLNSPKEEVVEKAILDLIYHNHFLDCLQTNESSKLILHVGGVYGDKKSAINRFITNYQRLSEGIKKRLIIENDDVSFNIDDVLYIANQLQIPVVFDNLHHAINPSSINQEESKWVKKAGLTWGKKDGNQKIHYSQQALGKAIGSHSQTINVATFLDFYHSLSNKNVDIMLEVKDKNLSAVKCIHVTNNVAIKYLENEWSKYKYVVLEKSHNIYQAIRELLKDKHSKHALAFYTLIEGALEKETNTSSSTNALEHVWGYFSNSATDKEKQQFFKKLQQYQDGSLALSTIKKYLLRLANQYNQTYLQNSYYFDL